jgi:hypothetical protein
MTFTITFHSFRGDSNRKPLIDKLGALPYKSLLPPRYSILISLGGKKQNKNRGGGIVIRTFEGVGFRR